MAIPRPGRDDLLIAAVLGALAVFLAASGWAWRAERVAYDAALALWRRPPPADVVIVAIDDASIAAIGRWPWSRAVHATLLEKLAAAKPRAVLLDLVLSEPDPDPRQDELLADALRRAAPVVLPVAWQRLDAVPGRPLQALEPVAPLRAAAVLGTAEASVDADGVLRSGFLSAGLAADPRRYPHLAVALLRAGGESGVLPAPGEADADADRARGDPAGGTVAWRREGRFLLRYVGPPGSFERIPYVDVLAGRVDPARLAGRYLLVGMTAQGLGDTLATPVNVSTPAMPGIEVVANLFDTVRRGAAIREPTPAVLAAGSGAAAVLLVFALGIAGPRRALPLALGLPPLALLASVVGVRAGWHVSAVPFVLATVAAYPLWSWRRLEGTMRSLDFLADTLERLPNATLVSDARGRVRLANAQAAALFEVDAAAELRGLDLPRLLGEFSTGNGSEVDVDWATLVAGHQADEVIEATLPGRGDYLVHLGHAQLRGEPCCVVAIADVRPLKDAERQREEALAFVSHDLRSPAAAIVTLTGLHRDGAIDERQLPAGSFVAEVQRLAARTLALSDEFVRAAQAQTRPLQLEPMALAALIDAALGEQRGAAQAAAVQLTSRVLPAGATVRVDRLLVERAITNLVSNAVKLSPAQTTVDIEAELGQERVVIRVLDRGPGFSDEQLSQLAAGRRGAEVRDRRGVGLGLQFVQRVAARHGGALRAERRSPGPGSCMTLELARR